MADKSKQKEKDPVNIVHQNAISRETIHKEQRHQKLYTNFGVNPYKKSMSPTHTSVFVGIHFYFFVLCPSTSVRVSRKAKLSA